MHVFWHYAAERIWKRNCQSLSSEQNGWRCIHQNHLFGGRIAVCPGKSQVCCWSLPHANIHWITIPAVCVCIYMCTKITKMLPTVHLEIQAITSSMLPRTPDLCGGSWKQRTQHHKSIADQKDDAEDPRNVGNDRPSRSCRFLCERFLCGPIHDTWWALSPTQCRQGCPIL